MKKGILLGLLSVGLLTQSLFAFPVGKIQNKESFINNAKFQLYSNYEVYNTNIINNKLYFFYDRITNNLSDISHVLNGIQKLKSKCKLRYKLVNDNYKNRLIVKGVCPYNQETETLVEKTFRKISVEKEITNDEKNIENTFKKISDRLQKAFQSFDKDETIDPMQNIDCNTFKKIGQMIGTMGSKINK